MRFSSLTTISAAIRAWTWLYTLPLDWTARTARRDEIASDLWESQNDPQQHDSDIRIALQILGRAVLGAPDDLRWTCEQLHEHARRPSAMAALRLALVAVFASGFVVSVNSRTIDPARALRVNIASIGWLAGSENATTSTLTPAIVLTLTNVGEQMTGALQVNAVFYYRWPRSHEIGTAYSSAVGWRGLRPGATSPPITLRGNASGRTELAPQVAVLRTAMRDAVARLFIQHDGQWTLVDDYPLHAHLIDP